MQTQQSHIDACTNPAVLSEWYQTRMFPPNVVELYRVVDEYAAESARAIALQLGLFEVMSESPQSLQDVYQKCGVARQGQALVQRVVQILCEYGRGTIDGDRAQLQSSEPLFNRATLRQRGLAADPALAPAFAMADKVVEQALPFSRGETDDNSVRAKVHIDFFLSCPIGLQCSRLGGVVLREFVKRARDAVDILELGGGTTSGATGILDALAEQDLLTRVQSYRFTELNPFFVMNASKTLPERYPGVRSWDFLFMNFDRSFEEQGVAPESVDIVYSVNALHCAKDLSSTLRNTARILKRGGVLLIAQFTRADERSPLPFVDLVCDPLASYWDVALDPDLRPRHGIHSFQVWKNLLDRAGFQAITVFPEVVPGLASFDSKYFLGVVMATKP